MTKSAKNAKNAKSGARWVVVCVMFVVLAVSIWTYSLQMSTVREAFEDVSNLSASPSGPEIQKWTLAMIQNAALTNKTNQARGPMGPAGRQGPRGNDGGTFVSKGPLRAVSQPALFVERTYGTGPNAKGLLSAQSFLPPQTWTLGSDSKLCSAFNPNECLTMDDTGNVFMTPKPNAIAWTHKASTGLIQATQPIGGRVRCLNVKKADSLTTNQQINGQPQTGQATNLANANYLVGDDCQQSTPWSFY